MVNVCFSPRNKEYTKEVLDTLRKKTNSIKRTIPLDDEETKDLALDAKDWEGFHDMGLCIIAVDGKMAQLLRVRYAYLMICCYPKMEDLLNIIRDTTEHQYEHQSIDSLIDCYKLFLSNSPIDLYDFKDTFASDAGPILADMYKEHSGNLKQELKWPDLLVSKASCGITHEDDLKTLVDDIVKQKDLCSGVKILLVAKMLWQSEIGISKMIKGMSEDIYLSSGLYGKTAETCKMAEQLNLKRNQITHKRNPHNFGLNEKNEFLENYKSFVERFEYNLGFPMIKDFKLLVSSFL